jgi:hypothetical protein
VLKITGPQRYEEVVASVHEHLPPKHEPFVDLIPAQGVKLTPRHYAYLKISEGCNHHCSFCIIPSMRGRLVSRPIGEVLREAEQLVRAGVKEILVISQDTSAYGVDLKYAAQTWRNAERRARFYDLAAALGELGAWIRLHYVYPYPHVDQGDRADGRGAGAALPRHSLPACQRAHLEAHEAPAAAENTLERIAAWRASSRTSPSAAPSSSASPARPRRISPNCSTGCASRSSTASAASNIRRSKAPPPTPAPAAGARRGQAGAPRALHGAGRRDQRRSGSRRRSAARCRCWSTASTAMRPSPVRQRRAGNRRVVRIAAPAACGRALGRGAYHRQAGAYDLEAVWLTCKEDGTRSNVEITADRVVLIHYTLKDDAGAVLDSSAGGEPLAYIQGHGNLVPGLEKALEGKQDGQHPGGGRCRPPTATARATRR